MNNGKVFLGIGVGASRVKLVTTNGDGSEPQVILREHLGNPREVTKELLQEISPDSVAGLAVTGGDGATLFNYKKTCESEALEESLRVLNIQADAVVSLGGESFVVYPLDSTGHILDAVSGNRCAAGTVEFFKQQLGRMDLTIEEGADLADQGKVIPLAKRCSVHCKSDCTHALNKRRCTVADIVRTLCHNMAEKAAALLQRSGITSGRLLAIGGGATNRTVIEHLAMELPDCEVSVPKEAEYFEALGAASVAKRQLLTAPANWSRLFAEPQCSFSFLDPLENYAHMVTFLPSRRAKTSPGKKYLLGIDGGSTTTKAALVDPDSLEICAACYLRTNGNPEQAMKQCLTAIRDQVREHTGADDADIIGLATTGSSGEILSVLCDTPAYHNEIIAHAYGTSYFCPEVDTIFEIGGQDAKFTSLRAKVAVDFNMNESCSAGTGSFIEEAAKDDLGVAMEHIADHALKSKRPPRFSDQCAAFANTDIRKAFQEGATKEDNLAGLVYAIVENYMSKVVGDRKIGSNILFQGGTSKNKAIAYAFAAKTGKHITVPPDSELIGCFGIALWLRDKLQAGALPEKQFRLADLLDNSVTHKQEFACNACENFCTIQNLTIRGKKHPFGGQCSKWENARQNHNINVDEFDHVARRNTMLFEEFGVPSIKNGATTNPVIGMQAVFSVCAFYPLYSWFFSKLGYDIQLSEHVDSHGVRMCQSNSCYPYEIAHGTFQDLVNNGVTRIFVPHVAQMPRDQEGINSLVCPLAQATPYYLAATFQYPDVKVLNVVIDMAKGLRAAEPAFVKLGKSLGHDAATSLAAFRKACEMQKAYETATKEEGRRILDQLEREDRIAVALVGRPYNAFSKLANMGVPRKFASRGIAIIPYEFLPYDKQAVVPTMYWKYGQDILRSLHFVKTHPKLYPVFVSNFGCGPDSFIQHFAASIMGKKPMLYLELDSHTADAGIGTRAAAFLDIIAGYRKSGDSRNANVAFRPAECLTVNGKGRVRTSSGELVHLTDPRVTVAIPSMGRLRSEAVAAAARRSGCNAIALPEVDDRVLAVGKSFTSGKECSPAIFTVGSLMDYCQTTFKKKRADEILLFFMPTASGPCRFGQYNVYMKTLIESMCIEDVTIFSPSAVDGYGGLGPRFLKAGWQGFVISDVMRDIRAMLNVAAEDKVEANTMFETEWQRILDAMSTKGADIWDALRQASSHLRTIKLNKDPTTVPHVLLTGEIYARSDKLSRRGIEDMYADEGLFLKIADGTEWLFYIDWHYLNRLAGSDGHPNDFLNTRTLVKHLSMSLLPGKKDSRTFVKTRLKYTWEQMMARKVVTILRGSGLVPADPHPIQEVMTAGSRFVSTDLLGEAILTAGASELAFDSARGQDFCGLVLMGPFNCMPTAVAESVLKPYARKRGIPCLTFETDGGPLTPGFRQQMEVHIHRSKLVAADNRKQQNTSAMKTP